ncbi:hypothetical protein [Pedobacter sp. N23S346]|uniref:hypothetical protein n=1 Tax=Pedobacter sp. N23S346 TaxID=3402750 RepID=UPI003AD3DBC0
MNINQDTLNDLLLLGNKSQLNSLLTVSMHVISTGQTVNITIKDDATEIEEIILTLSSTDDVKAYFDGLAI